MTSLHTLIHGVSLGVGCVIDYRKDRGIKKRQLFFEAMFVSVTDGKSQKTM